MMWSILLTVATPYSLAIQCSTLQHTATMSRVIFVNEPCEWDMKQAMAHVWLTWLIYKYDTINMWHDSFPPNTATHCSHVNETWNKQWHTCDWHGSFTNTTRLICDMTRSCKILHHTVAMWMRHETSNGTRVIGPCCTERWGAGVEYHFQ